MFNKLSELVSLTRVTTSIAIILVQMEEWESKRKTDKIPAQIAKLERFFRESGSPSVRQCAGIHLSFGYLATGKIHEAFEVCQKAMQIKDARIESTIDNLLWVSVTDCVALNPEMSLQDVERFAPSIESFVKKISDPAHKASAYGSLARAFVFRDDPEQAGPYWQKSIYTGESKNEAARKWIMLSEEQAAKWKAFKLGFEAEREMATARPRMGR